MKKLFISGGIAGLLVGALWLLSIASTAVPAPAAAKAALGGEFERFPIGKAVVVDFDAAAADFGVLSEREQRDQALDWLMIAALAQTNMDAADLNRATFDQPPVRHGYLTPVANFEFGATRSRLVSQNRVLAVIPAMASDSERADYLSAAFDEQRKNLGAVPREIIAFEYKLGLKDQPAILVRRAPVPASDMLSAAYGYRETKVASLALLREFLTQTNDIVYAELRDNHLVLGGRALSAVQYVGVSVDAVATLWQSEHAMSAKKQAFDRDWELKKNTFNAKWRQHRGTKTEHDAEWAVIQRDYNRARKELGATQHSGFSLDPTVDYERLIARLQNLRSPLLQRAAERGRPIDETKFDNILAALSQQDMRPYLELQRALRSESTPVAKQLLNFLGEESEKATFQHARYDGELSGTQVGMTLFYTDLLAKLWALDFGGNATRGVIADFRPLTRAIVSPVFEREIIEHNNTRLWFGHQDKGMQLGTGGNSLAFARNATRIYAASSDSLVGEESEPNAASAQFLGWWDDHYEEIAGFEPQYERLNQIMKWSAILGWLNAQNNGDLLKFLADVHVERSSWFPDWARRQAKLRYSGWDKVGFFLRADPRSSTEALPLLSSVPYQSFGTSIGQLTGGVSLAAKDMFIERKALTESAPGLLRRSVLDYSGGVEGTGHLKTLAGVTHTLSDKMNQAKVVSRAREGSKLRMADGELANGDLERTIARDPGGLSVETGVSGKPAGSLHVDNTRNGLRVAWQNREADSVRLATTRASRAPDFAEGLMADPDIFSLVRLPGNDHFAFRLRDGSRWTEVQAEAAPSANLAAGWDGRVADSIGSGRRVQFRIMADGAALDKAGGGDFVLLKESAVQLPAPTKVALARLTEPEAGLAGSLRSGDTAAAARNIAADPAAAARVLNKRLREELAAVDGLIADGRLVLAGARLEQLRALHGNLPDIQLRTGVALIGRGRSTRAVESLDNMASTRLRDGPTFFDEIARRISKQDGAHADGLERWADFAAWREGTISGKGSHGRLQVEAGESIRLAMHDVPIRPAGAKPVDPAGIAGDKYLLYVQNDLPGMNSVDWNLPLGSALHQLPDGSTATVLKLENVSVAQYRPDLIYAPDVGRKLELAPRRTMAPRSRAGHASQQQCDNQGTAETVRECPGQPPPVYLVLSQR